MSGSKQLPDLPPSGLGAPTGSVLAASTTLRKEIDMYEDDFKWTSQQLLYYKDEKFETDGYLRVSISTKTKDYKSFSTPNLIFSIGNQFQRSYTFDIFTARDLLESFKYAFNGGDIFKDNSQIVKQKMTTQFIIEFAYVRQQEEKVIKLTIKHGDTDFTKVILPTDVFQVVANTTKYYVDKYYDICIRQYQTALQGETTEILQQLPSLIKQMPSHIIPVNYMDNTGAAAPPEEMVKETEMTIADLDTFVGSDMKNIKVPELEMEQTEVVSEVKSDFVEKFIKNDLRNLETILNSTNNYEEIGQQIADALGIENMIPGANEEEEKSLLYVSKMLVNMIEMSWTKFETPIPNSTPILRYRGKTVDGSHLEMVYDLLLFGGYIRTLRRRLEDKMTDANENKSLFHLRFRCYLDPFYFSFLEKTDVKTLSTIINNRFKYYDSIGVFKEYENLLNIHNCVRITTQDILTYVREVSEKAFTKTPIIELHDILQKQNNFRIGSNSNFSKEQIINEIVPLEIAEFLGQEPPNIEVSDEVKNFFQGKKKVEKKVEKKNHLLRVIGTYKNEIPESCRDDFMKFIESFADKNFDFTGEYPYQEFGDDIIKALYVWKPEDNPRIRNSLKFYQTQIDSEVMEKEYILSLDDKKAESSETVDFSEINWE